MKKSLRRILERLRTATQGRVRNRVSVRGGLQQPQRMQPLLPPAGWASRS